MRAQFRNAIHPSPPESNRMLKKTVFAQAAQKGQQSAFSDQLSAISGQPEQEVRLNA
jgi:hypothetical protein